MDAIKENEVVIQRMLVRIELLKQEVEGRGSSWLEFQSAEELEEGKGESLVNGTAEGGAEGRGEDAAMGGVDEGQGRSEAWRDGTFQTGIIVDGEVRIDGAAGASGTNGANTNGTGGRLDDEALRRALEENMRALAEDSDEEGGMHL